MPLAMLLLLYVNTFTAPSPSVDGVKIVTRQITSGFTDTRTEYLAADRLRNEWQSQMRDGNGPPMATIILRGEHDRVFMLDLAAHEYVTYESGPHGTTLGIKPKPIVDSGGTLQISIENIDTGERKEIFGHVARHIITREKRVAGPGACSKPSVSETDGWYIDASVMPQWRQQKKNSFGVVLAAEVSAGSSDICFNKMDKIEVHRTGAETGFPVKITTTLQSEVTQPDGSKRTLSSTWGSEVVELKEGPLELALFDVPSDFRRVQSLKSWTAQPPRQLTGWEWFKEKVQELFR
ncbi:MAG TPA: hypothetical protein VH724_10385 [Candidatus Angelobacter sp.]|jgi:hypothetical protein|nr:hypothetical protein [Candidatus Angelobacter sp.]